MARDTSDTTCILVEEGGGSGEGGHRLCPARAFLERSEIDGLAFVVTQIFLRSFYVSGIVRNTGIDANTKGGGD